MAYHHDGGFAFSGDHQQQPNLYYSFPIQHTTYPNQNPYLDPRFQPFPFNDYSEFMPGNLLPDEFDDGAEVTTRPRLTKEQVEVLEAQFQMHPKPNSVVKRQLAMQTKLSLPRVANWFQNRRAKAKQQRKQEEFENSQSKPNDHEDGHGEKMDDDVEDEAEIDARTVSSSASVRSNQARARSNPAASVSPSARDPGWKSLQHTLAHVKATQQQRAQEQAQVATTMPPPEIPRQFQSSNLPLRAPQPSHMHNLNWSNEQPFTLGWSSPPPAQDVPFDFGFDQDLSSSNHGSVSAESPSDDIQQSFVVAPDQWDSNLTTPTVLGPNHMSYSSLLHSPPLATPTYAGSRRGSAAEALTAGFKSFALAGSSPNPMPPAHLVDALRQTDGEVDLAARRKRPRPAALTSASLRSRSYGALTSTTPTSRPGITPPNVHTIRHVKSTGHSLNTHYAGIRKSSLAQKSPLNVASFAEAESFKKLMANQAAASQTPVQAEFNVPALSPEVPVPHRITYSKSNPSLNERIAQYHTVQSPPITPFRQDAFMPASSAAMPPVTAAASAAGQFASFAEYTPPYSAGPLTNSSWSDAPLTSPDLGTFPPVTYIPSLSYGQQPDTFQSWVLPSDQSPDLGMGNTGDPVQTEFFIQEFPGQKEEHASVAQQLSQQKPKHYVFANSNPSDYD